MHSIWDFFLFNPVNKVFWILKEILGKFIPSNFFSLFYRSEFLLIFTRGQSPGRFTLWNSSTSQL